MTRQEMQGLLKDLSVEYDRLRPQSIRPAEGYLKYDYLIPAGFYKQMWDWDGFFIGVHLAARSKEEAKYLRYWVLNFVTNIDADGYVTGRITTAGPGPIFGKFPMKPFLAQGAYFASQGRGDFSWIKPVYEGMKKAQEYREKTSFDDRYGLFSWDIGIASGADNNPALTNDENDRSAVLAADVNALQLREYISMREIAGRLGKRSDRKAFGRKAEKLKNAIREHLWFPEDASFFNIRRDSGAPLKRVTYSNFVPLIQPVIPLEDGRRMITRYLWNRDHMLSDYGLRSLSRGDPDYNNANIIKPYSNWQGPVWPVANFLYSIALKQYGFDREAEELAAMLGNLLLADIRSCGTMHEDYDAETGAPLAPTAEQSEGGVFTGFVGWNLLVENMLEGAARNNWLLMELPE